jgi:SAM-dependent methyltransferase
MTPARRSFAFVTELPGMRVTREQIDMIACRYAWAAERVEGADVLEVACGSGLGLGTLADAARSVVAGDFDPACLERCRAWYGGRIPLHRLDAQALPLRDGAFDAVILFEAIYYLREPLRFLTEARRVLRAGGRVLMALPNKRWPGFAPSPASHAYYSPPELRALCEACGLHATVYGAFPQSGVKLRQRLLQGIRRVATALHLVPADPARTEAIRSAIKRLLYRRLEPLPGDVRVERPGLCAWVRIPTDRDDTRHRVFYVEAALPSRSA